tara:strand:- start:518 stop:802 length:285 start_codon:yes stop_codon:yes gene_type:complete
MEFKVGSWYKYEKQSNFLRRCSKNLKAGFEYDYWWQEGNQFVAKANSGTSWTKGIEVPISEIRHLLPKDYIFDEPIINENYDNLIEILNKLNIR